MADPLARRVHELLNQAMEFDSQQRQEFLQRACRETPELAGRVEQLIAAVADSQSFLEEPALGVFGKEIWNDSDIPTQVGNYQILRKLGSGGMGTVYEALQKQPQRTVALKIPRKLRWKPEFRQQLQYESELLGRLRHAYIAQVYEAGIDDAQPNHPLPYFAMEFVPSARTIREYVRQHQLTIPDILRLMQKVCEAIQHAHQLGIIHRDLKPANILIDGQGNPKVIDFGVASGRMLGIPAVSLLEPEQKRDRQKRNATTQSDHREGLEDSGPTGHDVSPPMAGTLNYMSPEQCDPAATIDSRTDVYSLGVILHELVCGSLPYDLKGLPLMEALKTIKESPTPPAACDNRPLPKDVVAILQKAMLKDRSQRYSSVEALNRDISRYLQLRPVGARKQSLFYVLGLGIRRNRWMALGGTLLTLAIVTGTVATAVFAWRASAEVQRRRIAETETLRLLDQAVWQSYTANMLGACSAFQNREVAQVRSRLAAAPPQHRDWEWDFLNGMIEINERVIAAHDDMVLSFAQSSDGSLWATGAAEGILRIWDCHTGKLVRQIAHESTSRYRQNTDRPAVTALSFRNGSSQVVSGTSDGAVRIWDCKSGEMALQLDGHRAPITTLSVSPNGTIASTCNKNRAKLWDGQQSHVLSEINDEQTEVSGVQFCNDGEHLVTWETLGSIWLRSADNHKIIQRFRFNQNIRRVCVSQDGTWIAAGGQTNQLQLWQTGMPESPARVIEIPGKRSSVDSMCFAPDNSRLAIGRVDRQIFEYSLKDLTKVSQLQGHEEFVRGLAYNPSGQRLASTSGDGTLRVWNLAADFLGNIKTTVNESRAYNTLAVSSDGQKIAAAGNDRSIQIFDDQLRPVRKLPIKHLGQILTIDWSPENAKIASAGLDRSVRIWNAENGESQLLKPPHLAEIHRVAFSRDGNWLVSAGVDRVVRVWDLSLGTRVEDLFGHNSAIISLRFSQDGRWLASGAVDGSLILWDWPRRKLAYELAGHQAHIYGLGFDPSGKRFYSGSRDRSIRVWSTDTGQLLDVLKGHGQLIRSLDIHPDGTRLIAGSWFGDILFWDLERHDLVATFKGHSDIVFELSFDPQGRYFASCSMDKSLLMFQRSQPNQSATTLKW